MTRAAPAAVEVRAELAFFTLAFHGGDDFVTDDEAADIGTTRFLDEFLSHDIGIETAKGFDDRLCGGLGFCEHDADALSALKQLDDNRCAAAEFDQVAGGFGVVGEGSDREADAFAGEELERAELIA